MIERIALFVVACSIVACNAVVGLDDLEFVSQSSANAATTGSGDSNASPSSQAAASSGAGGGAASTSGAGGGAGMASALGGGCPGVMGPAMVDIGGWCIDETEVTNAQYQQWLANAPSLIGQPLNCSWNATFVPQGGLQSQPNHPVTGVDWCDAYAFCAAAGKRLCGQISGGPDTYDDLGDPTGSQWYIACSNAGTSSYAWGNGYQATICVGAGYDNVPLYQPGSDVALDVKQAASCHGIYSPFDAIWDLSGNVAEWVDSCDAYSTAPRAGADDICRRRGGSFTGEANPLKCSDDSHSSRQLASSQIGFRCCAP